MRIAVIGGAGGMGRVTVADAAASPGVEEVRVVDRDEIARGNSRSVWAPLSWWPLRATSRVLIAGVDAVVNAASHDLNMAVMRACLEAGAHYPDLVASFMSRSSSTSSTCVPGGGLAAAISMGSAPGVTNMLAAAGAERLDTVESIDIADAIIPSRVAGDQAVCPSLRGDDVDRRVHGTCRGVPRR